jgi:transcriptional/translational regulatory protein YebC/TACO1
MTLSNRIVRYLSKTPDTWVSYNTIYAVARQHGYSHDVITHAISKAQSTVNVGYERVTQTDHREHRLSGSYLIWYTMSDEDKRVIKSGLDFFETLPEYVCISCKETNLPKEGMCKSCS